MDSPAEGSEEPAGPSTSPASRRSFLRMAGAGVAGTVGAALAGGTAWGTERYQDIESGRRRGDGATVATLSSATSLDLLWRAKTDRKVVALTFDDGPGAAHTGQLLDDLRAAGVRASFAVVGRNVARFPDLVRRQHAEGHEILNHSWDHPDLSLHEYAFCKRELERTDDLVASLTGAPTQLIRPPFGRMNGNLLQYAAQTGQRIVLWDQRLLEDQFDAAGVAANIVEHLRPGTVVLGHDAGLTKRKIGMAAIPALVAGAKDLGYEFVTASEMFALDRTRA